MQITTIGPDLAKHWFQVHGVDASGAVVVRRKLRPSDVLGFFQSLKPCLVGMEACATAHHWARELSQLGHTVRLMPPAYVKPTSSVTRTMQPTLKRSVKLLVGRRCGSCR